MTEELKEINRFTRRELSEEDVYIFSVVLCDNEIDRDYERFSDEALETLSKLFVGVTGQNFFVQGGSSTGTAYLRW